MDFGLEASFLQEFFNYEDYTPPPKGSAEWRYVKCEIDKHLLNIRRHCKDCKRRYILSDITENLEFFYNLQSELSVVPTPKKRKYQRPSATHIKSKPCMVAYKIWEELEKQPNDINHTKVQYYAMYMFLAVKKTKLLKETLEQNALL